MSQQSENEKTKLSGEEAELVASLLHKLEPGFLPAPIFHEVTRLTATPILEIVPLRRNASRIEILLLEREADDPTWPGQLHTPGTVIRASDSFESALDRLVTKELQGTPTAQPQFVANIIHDSGRGREAAQVYWVELAGEPLVGKFYDTDNLPVAKVASQLDFIKPAIVAYASSKE